MITDWEIEDGKYGRRLKLHTDWGDRVLRVCERENIQELVLLKFQDPEWESLDFLAEIPWIKSFTLLNFAAKDISGIHHLTQLESIYMADYSNRAIDFSRFPMLTECKMEYCPARASIFGCTTLESLALRHYPHRDLVALAPLTGLTKLRIAESKVEDISTAGSFQHLKELSLVLLRKLKDISPLAKLKGLEQSELMNCRGITNLDPLSGLNSLQVLYFPDCGNIDSLSPLAKCHSLKVVVFYEDTTILDGDIKKLLEIPNLKYVAFANRRHYNMKREEIPMWGAAYPQELKVDFR